MDPNAKQGSLHEALLESGPCYTWVKDFDGRYLHANPRLLGFLKRSLGDILGKTDAELWPADFAQRVRAAESRAALVGSPLGVMHAVPASEGRIVYWQTSHFLINEGTDEKRIAGMAFDVTARELSERALVASEQRFRTLVANIPGVVFRARWGNEGWVMEYVSRSVEDITGYSPAELLEDGERSYLSLIHETDAPRVLGGINDAIARRDTYRLEYRIVRADGKIRWVSEKGRAIFSEKGEPLWVDGSVVDVTDRKNVEEALEEQRAQLMQASKMSALGEMASGMAHEINNPLTIIHGKAEELLYIAEKTGALEPAEVTQCASKIAATALRISRIVNSLRMFARDVREDPFQPESVHAIIQDTLEFCRERYRHSGVELRLPTVDKALAVECRSVQISQVLLNLLNNAFDANEGQKRKWVEIQVRDLGEQVELSVLDGGSGIPSELVEKLCQPFFTTKQVGKGTGLGLSVSKGIVESHGGTLTYEPISGHTRFVIRLSKRPGIGAASAA